MELSELQNLWQGYENKISENTRINKEILKKIMQTNTLKRINWLKMKAFFTLIIPIPMIIYIIFDVEKRIEWSFYIGIILSITCFVITYYWAIKFYNLIDEIDFLKPLTTIKKKMCLIRKFRLNVIKYQFFIAPVFILGIFLLADIHPGKQPFSLESFIFIVLVVLVAAISMFIKYKYGIFQQIKKINMELDEMVQLEEN